MIKVAEEYSQRINVLLQMPTAKEEVIGEMKYDLGGTPEQIAEWEKLITIKDVEVTEVMGYPALLKLKVEELFYYNKDGSGEITRDYIIQNIEEETLSKRNRLSRSNHSEQVPSTISIAELYNLVKTYDGCC